MNLNLFDPAFCVFRLLLSGNLMAFDPQAEARLNRPNKQTRKPVFHNS